MKANTARITSMNEQSLMLATALAPAIGYDNAAALAKEAYKTNKTIRELALEKKLLPEDELDKSLDLRGQTEPKK